MQHTKYYSCASYNHAAHEDGSRAVHEIELTCSARNRAHVLYMKDNSRVTSKFGLSNSTKMPEHTRVATHECQLRNELYRSVSMKLLLTV